MTAHTPTRKDSPRTAEAPTLRDRSLPYKVTRLGFGNRFQVEADGRRYYVEAVWLGGDVLASCRCPDKTFNKAETCKHEMSVIRYERWRVAEAQGFYC